MITPVILLPAIFLSVVFWTLLTDCFPAKWSRMFCTFVCIGACFAILVWPFVLFSNHHLIKNPDRFLGVGVYMSIYDILTMIPLTPVSLLLSLCGYGRLGPTEMSLLLFTTMRPLLFASFNAVQIHCPIVYTFFAEGYAILSGAHVMQLIGYE
jgi:hypothetical protein